ncbi:MAG: cation:proton antiporter, partial [Methanolinea sp.]
VILPWIGGYATAVWAGMEFPTALFVGTALTATSIAITANVLQEMNKLHTDAARAIIGAAVMDDVLSLIALAITGDVVAGAFHPSVILVILVKVVAFLVAAGAFGILVVNRFLSRLDNTSFVARYPEFIFIFAMTFAFLYAMVAEMVGLSAIVGAFIAGIAFERLTLRKSLDVKEGAEYLKIIFASIFFVSLGIVADFRALTGGILPFVVVLTLVAIGTKVVGCAIPARLAGICRKDALVIGFGMAPRGEVAMIVALIGLEQGYIGQAVFIAIIVMSLATTLVTPILYRNWLYRDEFCVPRASGEI